MRVAFQAQLLTSWKFIKSFFYSPLSMLLNFSDRVAEQALVATSAELASSDKEC